VDDSFQVDEQGNVTAHGRKMARDQVVASLSCNGRAEKECGVVVAKNSDQENARFWNDFAEKRAMPPNKLPDPGGFFAASCWITTTYLSDLRMTSC
jgi:hypothetical protein